MKHRRLVRSVVIQKLRLRLCVGIPHERPRVRHRLLRNAVPLFPSRILFVQLEHLVLRPLIAVPDVDPERSERTLDRRAPSLRNVQVHGQAASRRLASQVAVHAKQSRRELGVQVAQSRPAGRRVRRGVTQRDDAEDAEDTRDDDGGSLNAIPRTSARRRWVANVEGVAYIASPLRGRIDGDGLDVGRGRRE